VVPASPQIGNTSSDTILLFCTGTRRNSGLVFKAHRLLDHSTLGLSVIKKRRRILAEARPNPTSSSTQHGNPTSSSAKHGDRKPRFAPALTPDSSSSLLLSSLELSDTKVYEP